MMLRKTMTCTAAIAGALMMSDAASAELVKVTVTNNAPGGGVYLTPVWVGFHNGSFDSYDSGSASAPELERIAEDGNTTPISDAFAAGDTLVPTGLAQTGSRVQGTLGGAPIAPGDSVMDLFDIDPADANHHFSYAAMVLPLE